jgi:hypothetical protein
MNTILLNKNTKIWLNYTVAIIISLLLWYNIYTQIQQQWCSNSGGQLIYNLNSFWLYLALVLMPVNILLETRKWQVLAGSAYPISFSNALSSFLSGLALSILSPNRIAEYPGRILYLKQKNTLQLISASVLGMASQILAFALFGSLACTYFWFHNPGLIHKILWPISLGITVLSGWFYFRFERCLPGLQRFAWVRKFNLYAQLMRRFSSKRLFNILFISMLRFLVFTAQFLILLQWMNVNITLGNAFFSATLFFGIMAIIPSVAITELAERGQVSLFLFHHFSSNSLGILGATFSLWLLNLIIPAFAGSLLILKSRWLR